MDPHLGIVGVGDEIRQGLADEGEREMWLVLVMALEDMARAREPGCYGSVYLRDLVPCFIVEQRALGYAFDELRPTLHARWGSADKMPLEEVEAREVKIKAAKSKAREEPS